MGVSELAFTPELILEISRGFSVNIGFWQSPEPSRKEILHVSTIGDKRTGQSVPTTSPFSSAPLTISTQVEDICECKKHFCIEKGKFMNSFYAVTHY
jgi:hypothetical protein